MSDTPIDKAARAKLYGKISAVTAEVNRIPKNGRNTFHNYTYATESDITDGLRELLAAHGLAFLPPSVISWERDTTADNPKQGPRTRVQMEFAIACCDTGELYTAMVWGEGQDASDKGFYKAYTGAVKYFLMKTFLIATGDDPEQDSQPARDGGSSFEQPRPAQPQQQQRAQQPAQAGAPVCEVHGTPMRVGKNGGHFCPTKLEDGTWCKARSAKPAPATSDEWDDIDAAAANRFRN